MFVGFSFYGVFWFYKDYFVDVRNWFIHLRQKCHTGFVAIEWLLQYRLSNF